MATSGTGEIIRHLRQMVLRGDAADMTDDRLLEAFVSRRDAAAFESLVRRHGPMVLGVCRRLLRDPHDVDDAFQAAFLVLARKAASVSPRRMVGNWLYGVAHTTAVRLRAANARRRVRERQVADMPEPQAGQADLQDDLHRLLDDELARLPDKYRVPVVLCDLEGRPRKDVARQLRIPEGTLSSRLTTARRMLAKQLTRRGLALSGGALAAAVSHEAASACIPTYLLGAAVRAATLAAAGKAVAGVTSVQVAVLTEGVLKSMFLKNLKAVVVVLLVIAALGGAAGIKIQMQGAEAPNTGPGLRQAAGQLPIRPIDDAPPESTYSVGLADRGTVETGKTAAQEYKGIFLKTLMAVGEHFEQITYADQYDGRIEARTVDATRTGILRDASVVLRRCDDGGFSIAVRVNKVRVTGDQPEIIGRDKELERVILKGTKPEQVRRDTPPTTATSQPSTTRRSAGEKKDKPTAEFPGPSPLKGTWRVVSVRGGERAFDTFRQADLVFLGERLVEVPIASETYAPAGVYQVRLGARRPVGEIDLYQKGDVEGTRLLGAYDVKGDELLLCLSARQGTRPSTLEASKEQALLVARRVKE
jgi:RNA polymerase sigma factor (sigma-70 family)